MQSACRRSMNSFRRHSVANLRKCTGPQRSRNQSARRTLTTSSGWHLASDRAVAIPSVPNGHGSTIAGRLWAVARIAVVEARLPIWLFPVTYHSGRFGFTYASLSIPVNCCPSAACRIQILSSATIRRLANRALLGPVGKPTLYQLSSGPKGPRNGLPWRLRSRPLRGLRF
jgi:hypothetical protein